MSFISWKHYEWNWTCLLIPGTEKWLGMRLGRIFQFDPSARRLLRGRTDIRHAPVPLNAAVVIWHLFRILRHPRQDILHLRSHLAGGPVLPPYLCPMYTVHSVHLCTTYTLYIRQGRYLGVHLLVEIFKSPYSSCWYCVHLISSFFAMF